MIDTGKIFDRILWALMVGAATYGSTQIQNATTSINSLNEKMAVLITTVGGVTKTTDDHEARIRLLEGKPHAPRLGN